MAKAGGGDPEDSEINQGFLAGFVGPRLRVLWNLLSARMEAALAPFGLRSGAFSSMAIIAANPGCSQNQLAKGLGMDKSAVVAIVDELETRGLVKRVRSADDRRRHALSLTAAGKATMNRMRSHVLKVGQPIREELSAREHQQLLSLLERSHAALAESEKGGT